MKPTPNLYIAIHIFLMIYSSAGILSKLAAGQEFLSLPFILFYAGEILILAFYAIGWQQFIKRMPLSVAYANKAVTVLWGGIWGVLMFHEHMSVGKIVGGLIVLAGIALYGYADGKANSKALEAAAAESGIDVNEEAADVNNSSLNPVSPSFGREGNSKSTTADNGKANKK